MLEGSLPPPPVKWAGPDLRLVFFPQHLLITHYIPSPVVEAGEYSPRTRQKSSCVLWEELDLSTHWEKGRTSDVRRREALIRNRGRRTQGEGMGMERVFCLLGEGLSEETFQQRPQSSKGVMPTAEGSVFQEEGSASAKALRW